MYMFIYMYVHVHVRVHVHVQCTCTCMCTIRTILLQALSQWHKVLNASSRGPCPELCLALSVEEQGEEEKGTEDEKCKNKQGTVTQQPQQVSGAFDL